MLGFRKNPSFPLSQQLSIDDNRRTRGDIVVDGLHGGVRGVDAAVRAVALVDGVAELGAPARVVDTVGRADERHPVVDKGAVSRTA